MYHSGIDAGACNGGARETPRAKDRAKREEPRNGVKGALELLRAYRVAEAISALEELYAGLAEDDSE